jgi:hypothetical protein
MYPSHTVKSTPSLFDIFKFDSYIYYYVLIFFNIKCKAILSLEVPDFQQWNYNLCTNGDKNLVCWPTYLSRCKTTSCHISCWNWSPPASMQNWTRCSKSCGNRVVKRYMEDTFPVFKPDILSSENPTERKVSANMNVAIDDSKENTGDCSRCILRACQFIYSRCQSRKWRYLYFWYIHFLDIFLGCTVVQAVSRRPLTAETSVQIRVSLLSIFNVQSGTWTGFSPNYSHFPVNIIPSCLSILKYHLEDEN